jgi:hypothetical protein
LVFGLSVAVSALVACSGGGDASEDGAAESEVGEVAAICKQAANPAYKSYADVLRANGESGALSGDTPVIGNYTAWPTYDTTVGWTTAKYDPAIVAPRTSAADARQNLASRFGGACSGVMQQHLDTKKPNVYLYFTGFGSGTQQNSLVDQPALMRWINKRDPKALIFSVNWSCNESHDTWCHENAKKLAVTASSPEYQYMMNRVNASLAALPAAQKAAALAQFQGMLGQVDGRNKDYNEGLSHSMQLAAMLIDQVLTADIGDVRVLGYSMGAHAAADLMVQDFVGDGSGYKWTAPDACDDGSSTCTVAHVKKVKWSLSLGLSGWSQAGIAFNKGRAAADKAEYQNGGLFRVKDARFNGKTNVFNRRMDPTGNSNDIYERGFNNVLFGEYNHYSHDYAMPVFTDTGFTNMVDAFLESADVADNLELGAYYDNAGLLDFDECKADGTCTARTNYVDHAGGNHPADRIPLTAAVTTTDGVPHTDRANNRAVSFTSTQSAIPLKTYDQEDLRGGVELYYRPQFDTAAAETHGLFSYGTCTGSTEDLLPQAYIEHGQLVFSMRYLGQDYRAATPVTSALQKGKWAHLAFTWELPVTAMATVPKNQAELPAYAQSFPQSAAKYGQPFIVASGLLDAPPTTYKRQQGAGEMRIVINGKVAKSAALGTADSKRDCLSYGDVIGASTYNP